MDYDQAVAKLEGLHEEIAATKAEEKALIAAAAEQSNLDAVLVDIERREADLASAKVSLGKAKGSSPAPAAPVRREPPAPTRPSDSEENN